MLKIFDVQIAKTLDDIVYCMIGFDHTFNASDKISIDLHKMIKNGIVELKSFDD